MIVLVISVSSKLDKRPFNIHHLQLHSMINCRKLTECTEPLEAAEVSPFFRALSGPHLPNSLGYPWRCSRYTLFGAHHVAGRRDASTCTEKTTRARKWTQAFEGDSHYLWAKRGLVLSLGCQRPQVRGQLQRSQAPRPRVPRKTRARAQPGMRPP